MRKRALTIMMIFIGLIAIGCSNENNGESNSGKAAGNAGATGTGSLIDPDHAIDERQEIVTMVEEQKEMLKPGFITEETPVDGIFLNRYTAPELAEKDQLNYASRYRGDSSQPSISYSNEPWVCEDGLDEWKNDLGEREAFNDGRVEGYYGHVEYASKNLAVKHNNRCYHTYISTEDGYSEADKRLLELMSKTFKTEEEGAYDPIYDRFTMDLMAIKFPSLNPNRVVLRDTYLSYYESTYDPNYSIVGAAYFIGEDFIMYEITDEEDPYARDEAVEELQTENGLSVTKYEDGYSIIYLWRDDQYSYSIKLNTSEYDLEESDLLEIVDSAVKDERSFDNVDFFASVTDKPKLGEDELAINEEYY